MRYGSEFGPLFREGMKTPGYWMEEVRLDFLEALISRMKETGISQSELAQRMGKSEAYISRTMNSSISNFTLKTMVQLALAVGAKLSVRISDMEQDDSLLWDNSAAEVEQTSLTWGEGNDVEITFLAQEPVKEGNNDYGYEYRYFKIPA